MRKLIQTMKPFEEAVKVRNLGEIPRPHEFCMNTDENAYVVTLFLLGSISLPTFLGCGSLASKKKDL